MIDKKMETMDGCMVFAFIGGALVIRPEEYAGMSCGMWLEEQHDISSDIFAETTHGCANRDGEIFLVMGEDYSTIDIRGMKKGDLNKVATIVCDRFQRETTVIWGGAVRDTDNVRCFTPEYIGEFAVSA